MHNLRSSIYTAFFIALAILFSNCKSRSGDGPIVPKTLDSSYSQNGIDQDVFENLLTSVDHIDVIFNTSDASMNIDGKPGVYEDLQYISAMALVTIPDKCQPVARKIYLSQGEILMEGDLYHGEDCHFQIFIKDGKELYGNYLTLAGVAYIKELLNQVSAGPPPGATSG